ncbi:type II toxin-antitoxin system RelE/ParE family toxin [Embleya sp. NPDC059237]|uniref:type II toxin-antitoxin system RelE/ParE family toxin n=1 Tax=Embleya sp. NPDC059237 TaxID=3346784 RepID=UPI0036A49335
MSVVRWGFNALPEAIEDLDRMPRHIRADALSLIHDVMRTHIRGPRLDNQQTRELDGCRKLYVGPAADWRVVYIEMPQPSGPRDHRDIVIVAAGPRADLSVYETAAARLRTCRPGGDRTPQAARARSAHAGPSPTTPATRIPAAAPSSRTASRR